MHDDVNCPGCDPGWPRPHKSYPGATCRGLVHAETFVNPNLEPDTILNCEVCHTKPRQ